MVIGAIYGDGWHDGGEGSSTVNDVLGLVAPATSIVADEVADDG